MENGENNVTGSNQPRRDEAHVLRGWHLETPTFKKTFFKYSGISLAGSPLLPQIRSFLARCNVLWGMTIASELYFTGAPLKTYIFLLPVVLKSGFELYHYPLKKRRGIRQEAARHNKLVPRLDREILRLGAQAFTVGTACVAAAAGVWILGSNTGDTITDEGRRNPPAFFQAPPPRFLAVREETSGTRPLFGVRVASANSSANPDLR